MIFINISNFLVEKAEIYLLNTQNNNKKREKNVFRSKWIAMGSKSRFVNKQKVSGNSQQNRISNRHTTDTNPVEPKYKENLWMSSQEVANGEKKETKSHLKAEK